MYANYGHYPIQKHCYVLPTIYATTEVQRRGKYFDILEEQVSSKHPALVQLIKQCLHNNPDERPTTEQLLTNLQEMRGEIGKYGGPFDLHALMRTTEKTSK